MGQVGHRQELPEGSAGVGGLEILRHGIKSSNFLEHDLSVVAGNGGLDDDLVRGGLASDQTARHFPGNQEAFELRFVRVQFGIHDNVGGLVVLCVDVDAREMALDALAGDDVHLFEHTIPFFAKLIAEGIELDQKNAAVHP